MIRRKRPCVVCGVVIVPTNPQHILCGDESCKRTHTRRTVNARNRAKRLASGLVRTCRCGTVFPAVGNKRSCCGLCSDAAALERRLTKNARRKPRAGKVVIGVCTYCGAQFAKPHLGGKPRKYCNSLHRQADYALRKKLTS